MHAILLLLILVPAPKSEPIKKCPYVGAWCFSWGASGEQTTHFYADGTCWSPEYESGVWSVDDDGALWFSERNNESQYVMVIDWQAGGGSGWRWETGELRGNVAVVIRRGEKLPPPREVQ